MQNSISLVNTTILNRKNSEVQNKITDFKYITPEEVNKLMAEFSRPQNAFVYQPTLNTLELKKDKGTDQVLSQKSNGVFNSKLNSIHTAIVSSRKLSEYE